jgi:hypothetical protein
VCHLKQLGIALLEFRNRLHRKILWPFFVNLRHQQRTRFFTNPRERGRDISAGGSRDEKTIEHAETEHRLLGIPEIGGTFGCHVQKLGIVPFKMFDDLCHARIGPTSIELLGE